MAAHEHKPQLVIPKLRFQIGIVRRDRGRLIERRHKRRALLAAHAIAPHRIDGRIMRHPVKPGSRIFRQTAVGPRFQSAQHRLLHGLLGQFQMRRTEETRQVCEDTAPLMPEQMFQHGAGFTHSVHIVKSCRTSMVPPYSRCGWSIARRTASS